MAERREAADPERLRACLLELQAKVADDDTAAGELVEALAKLLPDSGQSELLRSLEKSIAAYDFDAARSHLATQAQALGVDLATAGAS